MRGENSEIRRRGSPEKAENKQAKKINVRADIRR